MLNLYVEGPKRKEIEFAACTPCGGVCCDFDVTLPRRTPRFAENLMKC